MSEEQADKDFLKRVETHIRLANDQLDQHDAGEVSAAMMYATARFNAWLSAVGFNNADEMRQMRGEILDYFVTEYRNMLEENYDDYADNFVKYMPNRSKNQH